MLAAVKYAPEGGRGVALGIAHDAYRGGPMLEKLAEINARTSFIAQIETEEGIENVDAIAAVDGVDCLWIGHFDLSCLDGHPRRLRASPASRRRSSECARRRGRMARRYGRMVAEPDQASEAFGQGFDFICYGGDVWLSAGAGGGRDGDPRRLPGRGVAERGGRGDGAVLRGPFRGLPPARRQSDLSELRPAAADHQTRASTLKWVDAVDGAIPAAPLADCDALILLVPRFTRESIPAGGRLGLVARFGVGYDNVDVAACSEAGIGVGITPDGVRRPVAVVGAHLRARAVAATPRQGPALPRGSGGLGRSAASTWARA